MAAPETLAGVRLGGIGGERYELISRLGSGQFGSVWKAVDLDESAEVAVKLLHPATRPDAVLREAQLQRRLSEHPRIVGIRNVELGANPSSFVVLELLAGGSVQKLLDERRPTVRESHRWIRDVLEALDHAHREGVIHRDVKPSNLLLGSNGHALLTDFGVAEDSVRRAALEPGMYRSIQPPELGRQPTNFQSDLWLVGILAWQLLTGRRPDLEAAHAEKLLLPHRYSPEVPIALSRAVMTSLKVDPGERPASAGRMLEDIARVPVHSGWTEISSEDPAVCRIWQADNQGDHVIVQIQERPRGGFLVEGRAAPGRRLRKRRRCVASTEAKALIEARAWLTLVVGGGKL